MGRFFVKRKCLCFLTGLAQGYRLLPPGAGGNLAPLSFVRCPRGEGSICENEGMDEGLGEGLKLDNGLDKKLNEGWNK